MAKCLRCGAGAEWIEGRVKAQPADDALAARLAEAEVTIRAQHIAGGECERDLRLSRERLAAAEAERDALRADAERFVWWFTTDPHDWPAALDVPDNATIDDFRKAIDSARATDRENV